MKRVSNTRTTDGPITTWLMRRVVGGCEHSIMVSFSPKEPREYAAKRIRLARLNLHIACDQQRDAIRIQKQIHY